VLSSSKNRGIAAVVKNVFAQSPVDAANETARSVLGGAGRTAPQRAAPPQAPSTYDSAALASTYQVPQNVIDAVAQTSGIQDPAELAQFGDRFARTISDHLKNGMKMKDAMTATFGEGEDLQPILDLAVNLAAPRDPAPAHADGERSRLAQSFEQGMASATVRGTDMMVDMSASLEEGALGRMFYAARKKIGLDTDTPEQRAQALRDAPRGDGYIAAKETLERLDAEGFQIADWRDVRGLGSMVSFAAENIATSLPQMGATLASAPLSAPLTIALLGGEANEELKERTDLSEADRVAVATGAGTLMWGLEVFGLAKVFGPLLPGQVAKKALRGELADHLVQGGIKRSAARVLQAAVAEGSTETMQEGIVMAATSASGGEYTRDEVMKRLTDAFVAGGAAGGGIRAGLEPVEAARDKVFGRGEPAAAGPTATLDEVLSAAEARFNELTAKATGGQTMDPETGEVIRTKGAILTAEERAERDFLGQNMSNPDVLAQAAGVTIIEPPQAEAPAAVDPQTGMPPQSPSAVVPAPEAPPAGPMSRAAMAAGPQTRPDLKPDSKVRIAIQGGNPVEAVFKGESGGSLNLEVNGERAIISPEMMASGQFEITPIDALAEAARPEATGLEDLGEVAGAMGGNLRDMLFAKVESGDTTENGAASPILQMAKLIKTNGGTVTRNDLDAINTLTDEVMALPVDKRKAAALERAKGWTPAPAPEAAQAEAAKPYKPREPKLMKRPMTTQIKYITGGIDPGGNVGLELKARGITAQTHPGLFRIGGRNDLDNLPESEWREYGAAVELDGNGYVSQQWIIDSIEAEARGEPIQNTEQQALQQIRNAKLEKDDYEDQLANGTVREDVAPAPLPPMDRFSYIDEASRGDMIDREIAKFEQDTGMTLTGAERAFVTLNFTENEYSIEDSMYSFGQQQIDEGYLDEIDRPENNVPFGDEPDAGTAARDIEGEPEEGAGSDQRPRSPAGTETAVDADAQNDERPGPQDGAESVTPPATEQTPEGEQTLIEGVKPVTDRDRLEAQAKKPKRGGDAATDFGLFDTGARDQTDMFADGTAPAAKKPTVPEPKLQDGWPNTLIKSRHAAKQVGLTSEAVGDAWSNKDALIAAVDARLKVLGFPDLVSQFAKPENSRPPIGSPEYTLIDAMNDLMDMQAEEAAQGMITDGRLGSRIDGQKALVKRMQKEADDLAGSVAEAASDADPTPTEGQKEAGNYQLGHAIWNGLHLSIENKKGSTRSKTTPDGKTAWSVVMPAHYGYFKMTKGADGDHVDFYMGDVETSDYVMWIDQADAETGKFDEHKIMVGFTSRGAALAAYRAGFSDGKGNDRLGGFFEGDVAQLKAWLESTLDSTLSAKKPVNGALTFPFKEKPVAAAQIEAASEPKMPKGYILGSVVKLSKSRAEMSAGDVDASSGNWVEGDYKAVISRDNPYSVVGGYGKTRNEAIQDAVKRALRKEPDAPKSDQAKPAATGILSGLSQAKQDRAAELKKRLADKARTQTSSGLDPEYITLGGELVALYIEAGTKRFGQMLRDFAETTGLSMREAQAPMRDAYNHIRDEMDLDGKDVSDMDSATEVMADVRAALAEALAEADAPAVAPEATPAATPAPTGNPLADKLRAYADGDLVQHTTKRGRVLSGYILKGVTKDDAKKIDEYTFSKDGGFFIRENDAAQYLAEAEDAATDAPAAQPEMVGEAFSEQSEQSQTSQQAESKPNAISGPDTRIERLRLVDHFAERLLAGDGYSTIVVARKQAESVLGRSLTEADLKMIEESIESGIVKAARDIVRQGKNAAVTFDALVDLYKRQPKLAQRTSTSIEMQAYSTPAPMAFIASTLAGIAPDSTTTVYEPTAGTGMLLMNAEPANITANELQTSRMVLLSSIYAGADLRNGDAMLDTPPSGVDVVIANPPFGKVKDADGRNKEWGFEGSTGTTTEVDHAISMRALSAMADNGRAVLIVGGHQGDADARKQSYRTPKNRAFWKKLYDNYNVTEHFTLDGGLYSRQGAGWPVDVVVIEGRSASQKALPMKEAPTLYGAWDELKGRVDGRLDSLDPRGGRTADSDGTVQSPQGGLDGGSVSGRPATPVQDAGIGGTPTGQQSAGTSAGSDATVGRPRPTADGGRAGNAGGVGNAANPSADASVPNSGSANQEQSGRPAADQTNDLFGPPNGDLPNSVNPAVKTVDRNNTEAETDFQVQYSPRSNARFAVGTLVPKNVATAVGQALANLADRVGDIDTYVAKELGYTLDEMLGTDSKPGFFSAEQVDAIALAISNVSENAGFIIGDQTGVGKGRIVAGMIRYALRQGKTPVFFTVKPGLYGDMMRDLRDIGSGDLLPSIMVTNEGLRAGEAVPISSKAGDVISSGTPAEQKAAIRHMINSNRLPDGKEVLFTTYDQMNTQKGQPTDRMRAMMAIADNAMFILDESHEAGGSPAGARSAKDAAEPRSVFMRRLLSASPNGKMFSSATFAKNSTVMSLYSSTNMKNALPSEAQLISAVERGGDALLQVISSGLVQDGQYVRRERTYEGISMTMQVLDSDPISAENGALAVREIFMLDNQYMEGVRAAYIDNLESEGGGGGADNAIGESGASSTNFSSTMHNVVSQLLLSIKAKEVADKAIQLHKDGKKPIIALSNTNASIIDDYVRDRDLSLGDTLTVPFNEILRRYLQRLRRITIKDEDGNKTHHYLSDAEIIEFGGGVALDQMRATERLIDELDLGDLPGSPIDFIRDRMAAAGVVVGEITGRSKVIENGVLSTRKGGQAENKRIMNRYNSGAVNALIINRSGATGFSMHATDKADNDGKVRAMLILQPDNNIDIFMQMLGRVNRTGQIVLPEYYIMVSDLAVEKRPAALLMKKLASLNASTTANKKSAVMMEDAPDFMNKYGDKVIQQYLRDNPEVSMATGVDAPGNDALSGIAAKLTGKLIIMGPKRTEEIYEEIEAAYSSYIEELNSLGTNDLEATVLDVDARTDTSEVIEAGIATNSAFGQDTVLEKVNMKIIGKPYTAKKLAELVDEKLDGKTLAAFTADLSKQLDEMFATHVSGDVARRADLTKRLKDAKTDKQKDNAADLIRRHDVAVTESADRFREVKDKITREFAPGRPMMVRFLKNGATVDVIYAKSLGVDLSRLKGNPTAASRISVKIALASPARQITRSLSSTMDKSNDADISFENARDETVDRAFESGQAESREEREIITGNVINGYAKFGGSGQIVFFRRDNGELAQGLLMPKDFDAKKAMEGHAKIFRTIDQAVRFVQTAGNNNAPAILKTADEVMTVQRQAAAPDTFLLTIERKRGHKPYILNKTVTGMLGEFSSRSGPFKKYVYGIDQLSAVLAEYEASIGTEYQAPAFKDEAQAIIDADNVPPDNAPPDGGTLSAKVVRTADPKPMSFADRLKKIDKGGVTQLHRELRAELKALGVDHRITLDVQPDTINFPNLDPMDGYFLDTAIGEGVIGVSATAEEGPKGVLRHEIIHALRRPELWGGTHGLFTAEEWKALVFAARKETALRAEVDELYPNLAEAGKNEEVIAEMFRIWSDRRDQMDAAPAVKKALARIGELIDAIVRALRKNGANDAAAVFESIRSGKMGGRDPQGPGGARGAKQGNSTNAPSDGTLQAKRKKSGPRGFEGAPSVFASGYKDGSKTLVTNTLTEVMSDRFGANILALVPGRPLLEEVARGLPSAKTYLKAKMEMDSLRNEMHAATDKLAQSWRKLVTSNKAQNSKMMDLMHDATIAQVDPSGPFMAIMEPRDADIMRIYKKHTEEYKAAAARKAKHDRNKAAYAELRPRYDALPPSFQAMFVNVRNAYTNMANEFEKAVEENAAKAMTVSVRRAERAFDRNVEKFRDDGLTGDVLQDAIDGARRELETAKAQKQWSKMARLQQLRQRFEANRIEGPYFPLSRFGDFFVTSRDENGKVVSFSQFERVADQKAYADEMRKEGLNVETGVMKELQAREVVDPNFVADIEALLEGISADSAVMDAVWQQWLMTLPDQSMRTNRIHRKGRPGYDGDAFRAFGKQMFHGAHQLARLKYALDLTEALDEMQGQARTAPDPERAGLVLREIGKRHEYTMNPKGSAWSQNLTSTAFIFYLGITPAAAIVNLTQTTVIGSAVLGAYQGGAKGPVVAMRELSKALVDFTGGLGSSDPDHSPGAMTSARVTAEERAALEEAYRGGIIDKSQAHDLVGVGETGVEYSPARTKVMGYISFFFHHAERVNREVTFLAAYRMAKAKGLDQQGAIEKAGSLTFKTHFDYANTSRPRLMHNDYMRVLLVFRNHSINMLYRLFRDTHQSVKGDTPAVRAEARAQLIGISAQLLLHAGVKGVWGYAIIMSLIGLFFAGGEDEAEEEMEKTLLAFLPRDAVGMLLNGIPGHLTGIDLRSRIGFPELWFRSPDRELEGSDQYYYWASQLLGAIPEIAHRAVRGADMAGEGFANGDFWAVMRGVETASPKFLRDIIKSGRYGVEGAKTFNGDPIIDDFRTGELISQVIGFTPARLSERYDTNRRLKNAEARITDERRAIMGQIADQIIDGKQISAASQRRWDAYNAANPDYPITPANLRQSIRSNVRSSLRNEFGIQINPRLNDRLRENAAGPISR
jgi:predicted RNA methylase